MSLIYSLTNLHSKYTVVSAEILIFNDLFISNFRNTTKTVFNKTNTVIKKGFFALKTFNKC